MYPFGLFVRVMFGAEVEVESRFGMEDSVRRVNEVLAPILSDIEKTLSAAGYARLPSPDGDVLSSLTRGGIRTRWELRGGKAVWIARFSPPWWMKLSIAAWAVLMALGLVAVLRALGQSPSVGLAEHAMYAVLIVVAIPILATTAGYWPIYEQVRDALQEEPVSRERGGMHA